ncbi:MAG: P1 family peptidase, partial [Myxococcota bacterium]
MKRCLGRRSARSPRAWTPRRSRSLALSCLALAVASASHGAHAKDRPRARDLGVPFDGTPGPNNAITDVAGVEVGYATLIRGNGPLKVGRGPVRTGVTALHPLGRAETAGVFAARFSGTHWIDEFGTLFGPILLTNTVSVGDVHAAALDWMRERNPKDMHHLPVVAETWDGHLSDHYGRHIKKTHVFAALNSARTGALREGNVGGGTGSAAHGFKAGTGTASRKVGPYTVGVLVQANHGLPWRLTVAGVPVGQILKPDDTQPARKAPKARASGGSSIVIVVATDAPLLPMQLERFAKRPAMGVARTGGVAERGSGEIFLAFSTANRLTYAGREVVTYRALTDDAEYTLDYLYEGVVQATEEAIVNALVAADTMVGINGVRIESLDHQTLQEILERYNRRQ